jgi:CBS domain-containing protein
MMIESPIRAVLDRKNPGLWTIQPGQTVYEAIALMAEKNIGAAPVVESGKLLGMFSERDYTRKVILQGRASRDTKVAEIMSTDLQIVSPTDTVQSCLGLMTDNRVRHLPVLDNGTLVGIISIGDLVNWVIAVQSTQIEELHRYMSGSYPG